MKGFDAHIFSLVEDPNMTFKELIEIIDAICKNEIHLDEKVDGQNFTLGFHNDEFVLMQKGSGDFSKAKTARDIKDEIFHLSHSLNENSGRLISIKKLMLSHLVSVNKMYKTNKPQINEATIIECAMLSREFVNFIEYNEQHLGLVVLDVVGIEMDNEIFKSLGLLNIEHLEYKTTKDWKVILEDYLSSFGRYSINTKIGEFVSNNCYSYLADMGFNSKNIKSFQNRIAFKDKSLASHTDISKSLWKEFQAIEKSGFLYRIAVQPLDLILFNMLEDIFNNSTNLLKVFTSVDDVYRNMEKIMKTPATGDVEEVQKFNWEKLIVEPYLEFSFLNEGVVFTYKDKRYKITGAFTPLNKINAFTLYKSNKIKFN